MSHYLESILGPKLYKESPDETVDHMPSPDQLINKVTCKKVWFDLAGYVKERYFPVRLRNRLISA